jgi:hypothetical protein
MFELITVVWREEMLLSLTEGALIYAVYDRLLLQPLKGFSPRRDAYYRDTHPNRDKIASCGSIVRFSTQPSIV